MIIKTIAQVKVQRNNWGNILACVDAKEVCEVVGTWPCLPENIVKGTEFECTLEKQNFKRKVQYKIVGKLRPQNPGLFFTHSHLSRVGISHKLLVDISKEQSNLYDFLTHDFLLQSKKFACLSGDQNTTLLNKFTEVKNIVRLQTKYPFITDAECLNFEFDLDSIETQPYIMTNANRSFDMLQVSDQIAQHEKMDIACVERICAYCKHTMREMFYREQHYWFETSHVVSEIQSKLADPKNIWPSSIRAHDIETVLHTCTETDVAGTSDFISLIEHAREEKELANRIRAILQKPVEELSQYSGLWQNLAHLDTQQHKAVTMAMQHSIILSGKAGTGKTSVICEIINILNQLGIEYTVCAPTGKAATRISEKIGTKATTIHYAIAKTIEHDKRNSGWLIIDETSMLAPGLLLQCLRKLDVHRLILVGDDNQLPSIEPGCLLKDLICSNVFVNVELSTIHRQGDQSALAFKCHEVLNGSAVSWEETMTPFFSLHFSDHAVRDASEHVYAYIASDASCNDDIQMLVLTKNAANNANRLLQNAFNPSHSQKNEFERNYNRAPWREGDNIICTKNYYVNNELATCNGAVGKLRGVDNVKKHLKVDFQGIQRLMTLGTNEIDHSYALTVHKYQGSEIPRVVIALDCGYMLSKELVYTAMTRGKQHVHIYVSKHMWKQCSRSHASRETRLATYLQMVHVNQNKRTKY